MAAWQVAFDLHRHGQANSASEQFLAVYGGTVNFRKTGVLADNLGEAISKNLIIVNKHALVTISSATTGKMWAAHELGHAFNYALHPNTTDDLNYGQGFIDLALKGIVADGERFAGLEPQGSTSYANFDNYNRGLDLGYQGDSGPWVQNKTSSPSEDFADMFSNWAFDSFSPDIYGSARYSFMENHMSVWTALAVSNN